MDVIKIPATNLLNCKYRNPLLENSPAYPFVAAEHVDADTGTGLVHTAPGHGIDDYNVMSKLGMPPFAPVNAKGEFTQDLLPENLRGLPVLVEGTRQVLQNLKQTNSILFQQDEYKHRYPYDWRSKQPVIIRATKQWFANVESIKEAAIQAIQRTRMIPESCKSPEFPAENSFVTINGIHSRTKRMVYFTTASLGCPNPSLIRYGDRRSPSYARERSAYHLGYS